MAELDFRAVYTAVDKNHPDYKRPIYGNELYERVLRQVISDAMEVLPCRDVNIIVDRSRFITIEGLRKIAEEESIARGMNVKMIDKVDSSQNKCIQLADYIAGASRSWYESNDNTLNLIQNKISIARRH